MPVLGFVLDKRTRAGRQVCNRLTYLYGVTMTRCDNEMPGEHRSRRDNLVKALRHSVEEGLFVIGMALIALGVQWALQLAGAPPKIIRPVEATHRWLIIFTSTYIPARFWMSLVIDDIITGFKLFRRFLRGVSKFFRDEFRKWKKMRREVKDRQSDSEDSTDREVADDD